MMKVHPLTTEKNRIRFVALNFRKCAIILSMAMGVCGMSQAQTYPNRPVQLVVSQPPGGTMDVISRIVASEMQKILEQPVIVINKPGANGNIATQSVSLAQPDGYTLIMGTAATHTINPHLYPKLGYDPIHDFQPIAKLASSPSIIAVRNNVPAYNIKDLVALAKAKPGVLTYASAGSGGTGQLAMEMLKVSAKIDVLHVPYKGIAAGIQEAAAGRIDIAPFPPAALLPHFKSGALRPLAIASKQRSPLLHEVPTMQEAGFGEVEAVAWFGILAPAKTPMAVTRRLEDVLAKIVGDANVRTRFESLGLDITFQRSPEFAAFIAKDSDHWKSAVKTTGTKVD